MQSASEGRNLPGFADSGETNCAAVAASLLRLRLSTALRARHTVLPIYGIIVFTCPRRVRPTPEGAAVNTTRRLSGRETGNNGSDEKCRAQRRRQLIRWEPPKRRRHKTHLTNPRTLSAIGGPSGTSFGKWSSVDLSQSRSISRAHRPRRPVRLVRCWLPTSSTASLPAEWPVVKAK